MARYVISGGSKLKGSVKISGNKNSIFPVLGATLLTDEEVVLKNIPDIVDTRVSLDILKALGAQVQFTGDRLKINTKGVKNPVLPADLTKKLRGSVVLVGGLLGKLGKAEFTHPGGDIIGKRSISTHLEGLHKIGFDYQASGNHYLLFGANGLADKEIFLEEASVTATENLILASVLGKSATVIKNCAKEPHVVDLCNMLAKMGAKVDGIGQSTVKIVGVDRLYGCEFEIGCDFIEFGTFAVAAAITQGQINLTGCRLSELDPMTVPLSKMGINFQDQPEGVTVSAAQLKAVPKIVTNIWPGYPTDMMSITIVGATQAQGVTLCHDWMYESRMFFVDKLISMGANITIADPHRVVVYGPTKLVARELESPDIRAGMALVLAALVAEGQSVIHKAELIERGYENVVEKLSSLGADIKKEA